MYAVWGGRQGGGMTRKVTLRVLGVDLEDEAALERIAAHLDDLLWSEIDGRVCVDVFANESDLVCAAVDVACRIRTHLLGARVDQLDDDLVGIPDIAARTGLNRETIRSWTNGVRGSGDFPPVVGSLGGGQRGPAKVWRWRDVNRWLKENFSLGDEFDYPTQAEVAEINSQLMQLERFKRPSIQNGPTMTNTLNVSMSILSSSSPSIVVASYDPRRAAIGNSIVDPQNVVIGNKL
jgi:hypothetical protein